MVRITILIVGPADATLIPQQEKRPHGTASFMETLTFIKPKYESSDPSDRFKHRNWFLEP